MSITLSIPPAVVQEARAYALENGTTMSRMRVGILFDA